MNVSRFESNILVRIQLGLFLFNLHVEVVFDFDLNLALHVDGRTGISALREIVWKLTNVSRGNFWGRKSYMDVVRSRATFFVIPCSLSRRF